MTGTTCGLPSSSSTSTKGLCVSVFGNFIVIIHFISFRTKMTSIGSLGLLILNCFASCAKTARNTQRSLCCRQRICVMAHRHFQTSPRPITSTVPLCIPIASQNHEFARYEEAYLRMKARPRKQIILIKSLYYFNFILLHLFILFTFSDQL